MKLKKRAQVWSFDLLAGMTIFLIGIIAFFVYSLNQPTQTQEIFELLSYEGNIIANNVMSPGYPEDWDIGNVFVLGVVDDNKINETKLKNLYEIVYNQNNYTLSKDLLKTQYDYYIFFEENMIINLNPIDGIGKPGVTRDNVSSKNLIKTTRYIIYQNKTTPLYIYVWEE